jgi:hypothetical protein
VSLLVNGLFVASMRWHAAWNGAWIAELTLMPSATSDVVPSGRVAITSSDGAIALSGTVDDDRTGAFADRRHLRVVGGAGGWSKSVRQQHYHSDIGLQLREVATTTAAEVGETAIVLAPKTLGLDYVRHAGLASQIFTDLGFDWWVGADGATRIGVRVQTLATPDIKALDWQPSASTVSFTAAALVEPGTILTDARFGTKVVRQVDAIIDDASVGGTLWIADAAPATGKQSEIVDAFSALANKATRAMYGRFFEYTVDVMSGDRAELVAVSKGVPNLVPASVWSGISGYKAKLRPGSRVLVGFREGDPTKPFIAFYEAPEDDGWRPVELDVDALTKLAIGAMAASTVIGPEATAMPAARQGDTVLAGPFGGTITGPCSLKVKVG